MTQEAIRSQEEELDEAEMERTFDLATLLCRSAGRGDGGRGDSAAGGQPGAAQLIS